MAKEMNNDLVFQFLKEAAVEYVRNIGTGELTNVSNLRRQLKYVTNRVKVNQEGLLRRILELLRDSLDLGFFYRIEKKIVCRCKAFYGKTIEACAVFDVEADGFLKEISRKEHSIHDFYQKLSIPNDLGLGKRLRCPDPSCVDSIESENLTLTYEPESLVINLNWQSQADHLEILKVLISIKPQINLKSVLVNVPGQYLTFKGMILQQSSEEFIYCTQSEKGDFFIINDFKCLKVAGGSWLDSIYSFAIDLLKPVTLLYTTCSQAIIPEIDPEVLESLEFFVSEKTGLYQNWTCLCCDFTNEAAAESCSNCFNMKQSKVKHWECKCGFSNWPESVVCNFCTSYRFVSNTSKCGICKKKKISKECIQCNTFKCSVFKCKRKIVAGQSMVHVKCGKICTGYCVECQEKLSTANALCFLCFESCKMCEKCWKMHNLSLDCLGNFVLKCCICTQTQGADLFKCKDCKVPLALNFCINCKSQITSIAVCSNCLTALVPLNHL